MGAIYGGGGWAAFEGGPISPSVTPVTLLPLMLFQDKYLENLEDSSSHQFQKAIDLGEKFLASSRVHPTERILRFSASILGDTRYTDRKAPVANIPCVASFAVLLFSSRIFRCIYVAFAQAVRGILPALAV